MVLILQAHTYPSHPILAKTLETFNLLTLETFTYNNLSTNPRNLYFHKPGLVGLNLKTTPTYNGIYKKSFKYFPTHDLVWYCQ